MKMTMSAGNQLSVKKPADKNNPDMGVQDLITKFEKKTKNPAPMKLETWPPKQTNFSPKASQQDKVAVNYGSIRAELKDRLVEAHTEKLMSMKGKVNSQITKMRSMSKDRLPQIERAELNLQIKMMDTKSEKANAKSIITKIHEKKPAKTEVSQLEPGSGVNIPPRASVTGRIQQFENISGVPEVPKPKRQNSETPISISQGKESFSSPTPKLESQTPSSPKNVILVPIPNLELPTTSVAKDDEPTPNPSSESESRSQTPPKRATQNMSPSMEEHQENIIPQVKEVKEMIEFKESQSHLPNQQSQTQVTTNLRRPSLSKERDISSDQNLQTTQRNGQQRLEFSTMPKAVNRAIEFFLIHHLDTEGGLPDLFKYQVSDFKLDDMEQRFEEDGQPDPLLGNVDIACDIFRRYLKRLKPPVLPLYTAFWQQGCEWQSVALMEKALPTESFQRFKDVTMVLSMVVHQYKEKEKESWRLAETLTTCLTGDNSPQAQRTVAKLLLKPFDIFRRGQ